MSANIASLVNQQLYHSELLLDRINSLDVDALSYRAEKQALLNASTHAAFLAYKGFLQELAESAKFTLLPETVDELAQEFAKDNRSHAVVANIIELTQGDQWLAKLLRAQAGLFLAAPKTAEAEQASHLIALSAQAGDGLECEEIAGIIRELSAFIMSQREFLQEW